MEKKNESTKDSFLNKVKTVFYKSLGETFHADPTKAQTVDQCWGDKKGKGADWRNR